jgi:hypothetical protein
MSNDLALLEEKIHQLSPLILAKVEDYIDLLLNTTKTNQNTLPRDVGGSLKEYAQIYIPLNEVREQARQEHFYDRFASR